MHIVTDPNAMPPHAGGVFVPTMGYLHAGHEACIARAAAERDRTHAGRPVIVSIFVNPTQFDEASDFEAYPRDLDRDADIAARAGADLVFAPAVEAVYPGGRDGAEWTRPIDLPACVMNKGLEDEHRPGHFDGVYRVCRRLFELVRPAAAIFGEKDWQQLLLVRAMSEREGLGVRVLGEPTVREATPGLGGVALSSRNVHLSPADHAAARGLIEGIRAARAITDDPEAAERAARDAITASGARLEYAAVRDAATMEHVRPDRPARVLAAARVGSTRLIDNDAWPGPTPEN